MTNNDLTGINRAEIFALRQRINKLESKIDKLYGLIAVISVLAPVAAALLPHLLW